MSLYSNFKDVMTSVKLALSKKANKSELNTVESNVSVLSRLVNTIKTKVDSLATVATTGRYSDLDGTPYLANVATTGDYNDLYNKPNLKDVAITGNYDDLTNKPELATVATTGNYDDLNNIPADLVHTEDMETAIENAIDDATSEILSESTEVHIGSTEPTGNEKIWYKTAKEFPKVSELNVGDDIKIPTIMGSGSIATSNVPWIVVYKSDTVIRLLSVYCLSQTYTATQLQNTAYATLVESSTRSALPSAVRNIITNVSFFDTFSAPTYKTAIETWIANQSAEIQAYYTGTYAYRLSGIATGTMSNYWIAYNQSTNRGSYIDSTGATKNNQIISDYSTIYIRPAMIDIPIDTYQYVLDGTTSPEYAKVIYNLKLADNWIAYGRNDKVYVDVAEYTSAGNALSNLAYYVSRLVNNGKKPIIIYNGKIYEYGRSAGASTNLTFVRFETGTITEILSITLTSPYITTGTFNLQEKLPNGSSTNNMLLWDVDTSKWIAGKLDIPQVGEIVQGNTGYATGGDVKTYVDTLVGNADALLGSGVIS